MTDKQFDKNHLDDVSWKEYEVHEEYDATSVKTEKYNEYNFDLFANEDESPSEITYDLVNYAENSQFQLKLAYYPDYDQSTGVSIWKGAEVMVDYLGRHGHELFRSISNSCENIKGETNSNSCASNGKDGVQVLELGAGVGLPSLAAHYLGADRVLATDGDIKALEILRRNIERNRQQGTKSIVAPQLIWGCNLEQMCRTYGKSDVVLAADVCLMSKVLPPLFKTARELMKDDGILLLVHVSFSQVSDLNAGVLAAAEQEGFEQTRAAPEGPHVYVFRKKHQMPSLLQGN